MRESAVIRMIDGQLAWYPPGSSGSPLPLSDSGEHERLAALADSRRAPVLFAAPGGDITLREVSFLPAEKRHIARSLPYMLEEEFAGDIDDMHFACRPLGKLEIGVAACTHEAMQRWAAAFDGLPAAAQWVPEPLLLPWQEGELCIVIEPTQVVVRSGRNEGFTVERELATAMLAAIPSEGIATVIVYGEDQSADATLLPYWMQGTMQWRTGDFAAALMLAAEERQPLSLLQGAYGANLPVGLWWRQWRLVAGLFAAAFLLQVGATYAGYSSLEQENVQLRRQIEEAYRQAIPRGAVADHEKQLERELSRLRGGAQSQSFVGMMDRIGRVVAKQDGAQLAGINFNDKLGDVRVNLVAPDFRSVEAIRAGLASAGMNAVTENSNAQGDVVRARLKVSEK